MVVEAILERGDSAAKTKAPKPPKPPRQPRARDAERKKKREKKAAGSDAAAAGAESSGEEGEGEGESGSEEEEKCNWACCDKCGKWRRLPLSPEYESENLPDQWFCSMNPNAQRNTCDKPEERMGNKESWGGETEGGEEGAKGEDGENGEDGEESSEDEKPWTAEDELRRRPEEARRVAPGGVRHNQDDEGRDAGDAARAAGGAPAAVRSANTCSTVCGSPR